MATATRDAAVRQGREGSRWYNHRPTADEVVDWFGSVPLHDGMKHEHYIAGVVLIPGKEKSDEVIGFDGDGMPNIRERQDLVWTPYIKVETRVAYFWRLMEVRNQIGRIEPVAPVGGPDIGLPPGFFRYAAAKPDGKTVSFVGCSMRVRVFERSMGSSTLMPVMEPPAASKKVSTATRWDVDSNAVMKAETGAIGRALGFAGILAVPGSGVATAEDMHDASVPAGASDPILPDATETGVVRAPEDDDEDLRERAEYLVGQLELRAPDKHQAFQEWARERKLTLVDAQGAALRGAVRKLERTLDALPADA